MSCNIAFLAQGKLHLKLGNESPRIVESVYGQTIRDKAVKAQQRHAWKSEGAGQSFLAGPALWGGNTSAEGGAIRVAITSICRGSVAGQILYSLETDAMCGLLAVDNFGGEERRIWSKNAQKLRFLSVDRQTGDLACSVEHKLGTANLGIMLADGSGLMEATEGDSVDTAPRWVPGPRRRIVYQSAGVGRNRDGHYAGLAPFAIQLLDLDNGEVESLAEDSRTDLLLPQMTTDGTLYYIQRPYRTGGEFRPLNFFKDIFLFPFRLVSAIFGYLNFFSMIYGGKKLSTSGGARQKPMDVRQMMMWGNLIHAQSQTGEDGEPMDLVPKSWQLLRKRTGANAEVVAKGVLAYDVAEDGTVVYSNGNAIFQVSPDGKKECLTRSQMIEQVAILDAKP